MKQESNKQKAMEGTDGGLHPAVDGQSQGKARQGQYHTSDDIKDVSYVIYT